MNVGSVKLVHLFNPQPHQFRLHHLPDEIPGQKKRLMCVPHPRKSLLSRVVDPDPELGGLTHKN
jgi:hypothetical protein